MLIEASRLQGRDGKTRLKRRSTHGMERERSSRRSRRTNRKGRKRRSGKGRKRGTRRISRSMWWMTRRWRERGKMRSRRRSR